VRSATGEPAARPLDSGARVRLTDLPTPLEEAGRLSERLGGPRIWIKRDDVTTLGGGGSKVRKLEFLLADEAVRDATVLVNAGVAQSNLARLVAAAARRLDLEAVLLLRRGRAATPAGNLLIDALLGAEIRWSAARSEAELARELDALVGALRAAGRRPFRVRAEPTPRGSLGYVELVRELTEQCRDRGIAPDYLYLGTESGGTQAGVEVGLRQYSPGTQGVGVAVVEAQDLSRRIAECAGRTAALLGCPSAFSPEDIRVDFGYLGAGHGDPTPAGNAALRLVARTEGVLLDPIYTAKVMAGLVDHIRQGRIGRDRTVVFLHSGSGPIVFAHEAALTDGVEGAG
jgi:L-cysteate sulfo-lyase